MIVGVERRAVARRHRRDEDRAAAEPHRLFGFRDGACGISPGDHCDGNEARVAGAEVGHGAVVRARAAVEQLVVGAGELRRREGAEDELPVDAEEIERAAAFRGIEGAERRPALGVHQRVFKPSRGIAIATAARRIGDRLLGELTCGTERERANALANRRVGVLRQPVAELHDVAIGIVEDTAFGVGHGNLVTQRGQPCSRSAGRGGVGGRSLSPRGQASGVTSLAITSPTAMPARSTDGCGNHEPRVQPSRK